MCLYPKLVKNPKYRMNKKNGGQVPPVTDKRVLYVPIGCGKCMECMKKKAREWKVRLLEEIRHQETNAHFVTLTFSNESIIELSKNIDIKGYERDNEIARIAVRRFLERWRKKHKKSVRHWLVTELGGNGTENIHLHGIIWTDKPEDIDKIWGYGFAGLGEYVNEKTINYITKYVTKTDLKHKEYKPRIFSSPGIGKNYTNRLDSKNNKYNGKETKEYYRTRQGYKLALPIYYRNKIYNDEEREKLWLHKLDQQKRYVDGKEISIKNGENIYYKYLEIARQKNTELGYGNDSINWDLKKYENERRNMLHRERTKKKFHN